MSDTIQFETPENVKVTYQIAGVGSRFLAWIEDQLLVFLGLFILFIIFIIAGIAHHEWLRHLPKLPNADNPEVVGFYVLGIMTLIASFANFFYFGLSEYFMHGQTIGKRHAHVRVVKVDGYALDASSILVRNFFRILDNIPLMWIIPLLNARGQRLGDIVAGTVCVMEETHSLSPLRMLLSARQPSERLFRFDAGALARLRPQDIEAVEKILENFGTLNASRQRELLAMLAPPLAERMKVAQPDVAQQQQFLEDMLAAEYRRQDRQLG